MYPKRCLASGEVQNVSSSVSLLVVGEASLSLSSSLISVVLIIEFGLVLFATGELDSVGGTVDLSILVLTFLIMVDGRTSMMIVEILTQRLF